MVENKKKVVPITDDVASKQEELDRQAILEEELRVQEKIKLADEEEAEKQRIRARIRKEEEAERKKFYAEEAAREEDYRYKLLKRKREDQTEIEGIFRNHETRGGQLSFCYKVYEDEVPTQYHFEDGVTYKIPLGVARHINTNCSYPVYKNRENTQSKRTMSTGRKRDVLEIKERIKRFTFEGMLFQ